MKVAFGFETSKKQFIKILIEKKLKNKVVSFVKAQLSSKLIRTKIYGVRVHQRLITQR